MTSLLTQRFGRRLIEVAREFDKDPILKFLLVRPLTYEHKSEHLFYEKIFGDHRIFVNPCSFTSNDLATVEKESFLMRNVVRGTFESYHAKATVSS